MSEHWNAGTRAPWNFSRVCNKAIPLIFAVQEGSSLHGVRSGGDKVVERDAPPSTLADTLINFFTACLLVCC